MLTTIYVLLFYLATAVLVIGVVAKVIKYASIPAPLKIPLTPAPITRGGVWLRMAKEVVFFYSLFRANKWIWVFGWIFHFALLLVLLGHLRYFIYPAWFWVELIQPFGKYAPFAMMFGLVALFIRRIVVERIRYISSPSDYLMLLLLMGIGLSGLTMRFVVHTDIVQLKLFFLGLVSFDFQTIPADPVLLVHLLLVAFLMIIFPFSKLMHAPGVFFSPTRNQVDNPREKRHIADWARELESREHK